jgi:ABC-2 type transport system permease protein
VKALLGTVRILRYSILNGFQEFATIFTLKTWFLGWFLRVIAQVIFFALIGQLLGSTEVTHYLLVGNAVMLAAMESLMTTQSTTWERFSGTLPLLVSSPSSPLVVLLGRSLQWVPSGVASAVGAFFIVGWLFDLSLEWPRVLLVIPLIVLVSITTYALGTFLGGLVLRAMEARNLVSNVAQATMMALCGVNVPVTFFPEPVQWISAVLPLTHGLQAVRGLLANEPARVIAGNVGLEVVIGGGWLAASALSIGWLAQAGRRDGSLEFAA